MQYIEKYAAFVSVYDGEIYTYDSELTVKEPLLQSVGILREASVLILGSSFILEFS